MEIHPQIKILIDGNEVYATPGASVASVLLAEGLRFFRQDDKGVRRGIFCGMGVCFDCLVTVDGVPDVRACLMEVRAGMLIETRSEPHD